MDLVAYNELAVRALAKHTSLVVPSCAATSLATSWVDPSYAVTSLATSLVASLVDLPSVDALLTVQLACQIALVLDLIDT